MPPSPSALKPTVSSASSLLLGRRSPFSALSSLPNRTCGGQPLATFSLKSPVWDKPHAGEAPNALQGMDMRKIISCPWINIYSTRKPMRSGYQWGAWAAPQIEAFDYKDTATYFTQQDTWKEYSFWHMFKLLYPHLRINLMYVTNLLIAAGPSLVYVIWTQKFEPNEFQIEPDEYFENYRWHYYGHDLDHHGYQQYLEARRAKKWRDPSIDIKEWIPPQYRGEGGFKHH